MITSNRLLPLLGAMFAFCLLALPAQAQTRTWVSSAGSDGNSCSRTSPCKTFAGAITKTAAGDEINCLDAGEFGRVNINKSITISCEAGTAGALGGSFSGISVETLATDVVYLRGLDISGTGSGVAGIQVSAVGALHVEHCLIHRFNSGTAAGIYFVTEGTSKLFVSDSTIADNGSDTQGGGIVINASKTARVDATLSRVHVENNSLGIKVTHSFGTSTVNLTVIDSIAAGNTSYDVSIFTANGRGTSNVMIDRTSLTGSNVGLRSDGPVTTVRIGNSVIFGNVTGVESANGGKLETYDTNQLNGNTTDGSMVPIRPR